MKKQLALILASLLLTGTFAACAKDKAVDGDVSDTISAESTEQASSATDTEDSSVESISFEESSKEVIAIKDSGTWGDLSWSLDVEGTLVISGNGVMNAFDSSDATDAWHGYKSDVKAVVIDDGVTSVGIYAFDGFTNLKRVKIGADVKSIGGDAFAACYVLENVSLPESLEVINHRAFSLCMALKSVVLPDSVKKIGNSAFYQCDALESLTIGKGVAEIGNNAFAYSKSLKEIKVAEGNEAFVDVDGVLYTKDKKTLVRYPAAKAETAVTVPDGVEVLGYGAFHSCVALKEISIPISVTEIGSHAFFGCKSIEKVGYSGTEEQWAKIKIDSTNSALTDKYKA